MRTITTTLAAVTAAALLLTGCASPEHRSGDAAPAGSAAASPSSSAAASPSPSAPTSPAVSPSPSHTGSTTLVLGPLGYGALRLGMTQQQALATGLINPFVNTAGSRCNSTTLKGSPKNSTDYVVHSTTVGVAAIDAGAGVSTPEGVHVGTSSAEMRRTYPAWQPADGDSANGRVYTKVPGNDKAVYRLYMHGGVVEELTLQLASQDCYE